MILKIVINLQEHAKLEGRKERERKKKFKKKKRENKNKIDR